MKVKLVIVSPEVQPNEYEITLPTKIGRGHEAKLKLVHPLVSRLHCELFTEGEQVMVRDLDSLNGTFVDQQRLNEDTPLASGATVMMGTVMFRVVYGADADRLPPPAASDLDKTVAAPGTIRQETLAKLAKGGKPVTAEDLWEVEAEEPTAIVTPDEEVLDLEFADDEPTEEKPKPAAAKPVPVAKPAQPAAAPQPAAPAAKAPAPAKPPVVAKPVAPNPNAQTLPAIKPVAPAKPLPTAPAKNPADDDLEIESAGEDDDDLDDFFKSIM